MEETWILYQTTNNVNGKVYVGVHKLKNTYNSQRYLGSGDCLLAALKKYGRRNFTRVTLAEFTSSEDAYAAEARMVNEEFIKRLDTYNISLGGGGGCNWTPEMKVKMSVANIGKKHTEESRIKISEGLKGRVLSEEHKAKLSSIRKGKQFRLGTTVTDETKEKLRIISSGRTHTDETKEKLRAMNLGKTHTSKTKNKMSLAHKGNTYCLGTKRSEETRAKISEANRKRIATPETKAKISANSPKNTPVVIGEVFYKSIAIASRTLEILDETISYRVKNNKPKWSEWRYATEEEILNHQM